MNALICLAMAAALHAAEPDWAALEPQAVALLQKYIRVESVNPPADTRGAAELIAEELKRHGLAPRIYRSGPEGQTNLVVRLAGRDRNKKPLLLLHHFDVVPVDRKAWRMDPFGGVIEGGQIWGRGALDMKGIGVQQITALIALKTAGIVPARDIVLLITGDEETGGKYGIQWMIANHLDEIDREYVLDEGGFGSRDALANKFVFGIAVGEKQILWLRLRAKGTAAHGSQPIEDNANMTLLRALEKAMNLPASAKPARTVEEMRRAIGEPLAKNKFTSAIQQNTISLTTIVSGVGNPPKVNVIPSAAEATLDCRLLPGVNSDEFLSELKARINDPRVTVDVISKTTDAGASSSSTPLFQALKRVLNAHHPDATVTATLVPFGTDSFYLRRRGVQAYGFAPMVIDAATLATMHSDEERIPLEEFRKGLRIYFDLLRSDF